MVNTSLMERIEATRTAQPDDEFRLAIFGRPTGPWHPDKDSAERYAVKRKLGSYDQGLGITFLDVSVSLVRRHRQVR